MPSFSFTQFYGVNKEEEELSDMPRNIEQYVVSGQVDALQKYCDCCLYKIFDERILVSECVRCSIQAGIEKILNGSAHNHSCGPTGNS